MKEYGGYIELDTYTLPMLHEDALKLNCGRNCLAYLFKTRQIRKLLLPYFMCDSVINVCKKHDIEFRFYHVNQEFQPVDIMLADDEWLYVMNYYGQLTPEYLTRLKTKYCRVIVDNAQAYFEKPITGTDTLYTCRKFFGVADGAFLYTDAVMHEELPLDESFERMHFLLGRYERSASEFYAEYSANNHLFADEPIKRMSKLTENLLHAINYDEVKQRRTENFRLYHQLLGRENLLSLREVEGAFAYPLYIKDGAVIRKALQQDRIYVPTLWPSVMSQCSSEQLEFSFAENILPLPCDQRYQEEDIYSIVRSLTTKLHRGTGRSKK